MFTTASDKKMDSEKEESLPPTQIYLLYPMMHTLDISNY